jgi:hypothetical protein
MGALLKHLYHRKFWNNELVAATINNNTHLAAWPGENSAPTDLSRKQMEQRANSEVENRLQFPVPEEEHALVTTKSSVAINSAQRNSGAQPKCETSWRHGRDSGNN